MAVVVGKGSFRGFAESSKSAGRSIYVALWCPLLQRNFPVSFSVQLNTCTLFSEEDDTERTPEEKISSSLQEIARNSKIWDAVVKSKAFFWHKCSCQSAIIDPCSCISLSFDISVHVSQQLLDFGYHKFSVMSFSKLIRPYTSLETF